MLDHAAAVIQQAGLTSRQLEMIALQAWGLNYKEIAARTGNSRRTVDRELLRARAKLAEALRTSDQQDGVHQPASGVVAEHQAR